MAAVSALREHWALALEALAALGPRPSGEAVHAAVPPGPATRCILTRMEAAEIVCLRSQDYVFDSTRSIFCHTQYVVI